MCGICGYITKKNYSDSLLNEMRDTISYRGPDDAGSRHYQFDSWHVGMAHRRLSILDLSSNGHQPMETDDGRYVIVYNGEIYNNTELRQELLSLGYHFKSHCDTETFLLAFSAWGKECLKRINGMFGVAIWDKMKGEILLARDRIGKKPLYYYNNLYGDFVFASELKPIMKYPGFNKTINTQAVSDYFCNKFICAPNTIFENTYKLCPGSMITFSLINGEVSEQERYWNPLEEKEIKRHHLIKDRDEALEGLEEILLDSVRRRMMADVTVGSFISGGIDSTLVTALAQKTQEKKVKTFTIGFYNKDDDEAPYAKKIAEYIGTDHTEMYIDDEKLFQLVPEIVKAYDEPMSDASQIPSMAVSQLASKDVKVVVTGDGGDETFCGYKMYDWVWLSQRLDPIGNIVSHLPGFGKMNCLPIEARAFINNRDAYRKTQLFSDVRKENAELILLKGISGDVKYDYEGRMIFLSNWQERRMLLDMMTYMPDEVLCKMDRASMYYSLECRCPILDYRVIEKSFEIDQSLMYHHFDKKYILKELTYKYVPRELLDRPKKGFSPPIRDWCRKQLKSKIDRYADVDLLKKQGIFDPYGVMKLIKVQQESDKVSYSTALWSFYVFQEWYRAYIEDLW